MSTQNNTNHAGGIGFCGMLAILFIALKLLGIIQWSWLWVLAPIWIPLVLVVMILIIVVLMFMK
jgi:hypothetical protein